MDAGLLCHRAVHYRQVFLGKLTFVHGLPLVVLLKPREVPGVRMFQYIIHAGLTFQRLTRKHLPSAHVLPCVVTYDYVLHVSLDVSDLQSSDRTCRQGAIVIEATIRERFNERKYIICSDIISLM